ncbi:MAG: 6-phosphogluconolactonase [Candidatus Peribacteraceae bacterium]|nr:6-phosphogluconolactonase [Candidatus Peribacteraceae bacterium]
MIILRTNSGEEFLTTSVSRISEAILERQADGRTVTIGLSGGSTPRPAYQLLGQSTDIDWTRVTLFLVDERYVSSDAPESNQRMIRETLLQGPAAAASTIFPDTSLTIDECVARYDQAITLLQPDIVLLGMGGDGHIASLFPPLPEEAFGSSSVIHTVTDQFAVHDRISVTLPVLKRASQRIFLIAGEKKRTLLEEMQKTKGGIVNFPAKALFDDRTTWICSGADTVDG